MMRGAMKMAEFQPSVAAWVKPRMKRTRQAIKRRTPTMSIRLSLAAPGRSSAVASVWGMRNHARTENGAIMMAIIKRNAISLNS